MKVWRVVLGVLFVLVVLSSIVGAAMAENVTVNSKLKIFENSVNGVTDRIYVVKGYDGFKFIEVLVKDGKTVLTKHLTPKLINSSKTIKVLETYKCKDKYSVAKIIQITEVRIYSLKPITASSIVVKYAYNSVVAKNIFGIELWNLTAAGFFHVNPGVEVVFVADASTAKANNYLGWYVESFSSTPSWNANIGTVYATAKFANRIPTIPTYFAWSKVQVDKYLKIYTDGGTTTI